MAPPPTSCPACQSCALEGLSDSDARDLLDSVVLGGSTSGSATGSSPNPGAIRWPCWKFRVIVSAAERAGGFWIVGTRPSVGQVEEGFVRRIQSLPADTRQLTLLAAADPVGDPGGLLACRRVFGIGMDALAPAEAAELIEFGPRMRFHHPLVRSAAYQAADVADRRAVHRALARRHRSRVGSRSPGLACRQRGLRARRRGGCRPGSFGVARAQPRRNSCCGSLSRAGRGPVRRSGPAQFQGDRGGRRQARSRAAPAAAYELLALAELTPMTELQQARRAG